MIERIKMLSPCKLIGWVAVVVSIFILPFSDLVGDSTTLYLVSACCMLGAFLCGCCHLCFHQFVETWIRLKLGVPDVTVNYVVYVEQPDASNSIGVGEKVNVFIV